MPYGMDWDELKPNGYSGQLCGPSAPAKRDPVSWAISALQVKGVSVERTEFPPSPLPGLYLVNGRELTEMQLIQLAKA